MECSPLRGTCERNISVVNHSRNIHSVYTVSFLSYLIVNICIYLLYIIFIETTVQTTDSNVDISPFTRDNYIHGHHSSTTSCLHFVCVCNKSDLIGTLASVIVLTGQTCGDCHLFQVHQQYSPLWVSVNSTSPYFIWSFIRRSLQLLQSRMSMPRDNTRARREGCQPRYLDDFLLELPRRHLSHTIPDQAVGGAISPSHVDTLAPPAG